LAAIAGVDPRSDAESPSASSPSPTFSNTLSFRVAEIEKPLWVALS